uniref:Uncharacterized protein n=1 Tax=Chromera velia CCMP2878 TaxID=1169474 RepID=A0A0G4FAS4_9ALVE|eukprot:Cvel_15956.t1-p1 / transcript=Cvel_15956.t1 / gene=Cvel_15956 / organism=Chromera_velia_CCMP2878 / gene_product=hypothetical protein / transcript_product=hypothetical protein / location=Cvel_scaffold1207:18535-19964(+) / protein_length=437 / sequence_SO=supercontig / SO=protein_coding / is_pseudo=false
MESPSKVTCRETTTVSAPIITGIVGSVGGWGTSVLVAPPKIMRRRRQKPPEVTVSPLPPVAEGEGDPPEEGVVVVTGGGTEVVAEGEVGKEEVVEEGEVAEVAASKEAPQEEEVAPKNIEVEEEETVGAGPPQEVIPQGPYSIPTDEAKQILLQTDAELPGTTSPTPEDPESPVEGTHPPPAVFTQQLFVSFPFPEGASRNPHQYSTFGEIFDNLEEVQAVVTQGDDPTPLQVTVIQQDVIVGASPWALRRRRFEEELGMQRALVALGPNPSPVDLQGCRLIYLERERDRRLRIRPRLTERVDGTARVRYGRKGKEKVRARLRSVSATTQSSKQNQYKEETLYPGNLYRDQKWEREVPDTTTRLFSRTPADPTYSWPHALQANSLVHFEEFDEGAHKLALMLEAAAAEGIKVNARPKPRSFSLERYQKSRGKPAFAS